EAERAAGRLQLAGKSARDVAAVEVVQTRLRQMLQGGAKGGRHHARARRRYRAPVEEQLGEAGNVLQFVELFRGEPLLTGTGGNAVACVTDRIGEKVAERHAPA